LIVENGVLNYADHAAEKADATITVSKATLDAIQLKETTIDGAVASGDLKIGGNREAFMSFMGLLDDYPFWFNIVTP
jgi:alkyl sulfatase BDS1-like metallo-beta-lactamase superfamily hydrolase